MHNPHARQIDLDGISWMEEARYVAKNRVSTRQLDRGNLRYEVSRNVDKKR